VEAVFLYDMIIHIATHCPNACFRTMEELLQVATLVEQGNRLHFKQ
jgi:hypothetical protein